jgi:branched-chain amino acid transport system substrate-binding protein
MKEKLGMKKFLACLCVLTISAGLMTGCGKSQTTSVESKSKEANQGGNVAVPPDANKIYLGIVAARTGTNKASGEMNINGANLAVDEINAAGGILGKKIELVISDEIDNLQASVNATNKLLNDKSISAIVGTNFSQNILAVTDAVLKAKVPYIACGSNNKIAEAKNPYIWQPRNLDSIGADIIAKYAYEQLGIKNPAIMYSTIPNSMGPGEKVAKYYSEKYGINVSKDMMLGYSEEEKNFAPIIAKIKASGADGLITIGNINPFVLISKAIADAGLKIPRVANAAINSNIVLSNAGAAANGWYATCDWFSTLDTKVGQEFQKNYKAKYGKDTEGTNAVTYDSVYLIKKAAEIANSTTDRDAINKAMEKISGYEGVLGTFSYHEDHTFLNEFYMTQIQNQTVKLVNKVKYR